MSHLFYELAHWSTALNNSISENLLDNCEKVNDIDFYFVPPENDTFPCYIVINGRSQLLFELNDINPSLCELKSWMERATRMSSRNVPCPEIVNLDCIGKVISIALIPGSWYKDRSDVISLLTVTDADSDTPIVSCLCYSLRTVGRLYGALWKALISNELLFSDPRHWLDRERYNRDQKLSCAERMKNEIHSETLEIRIKNYI